MSCLLFGSITLIVLIDSLVTAALESRVYYGSDLRPEHHKHLVQHVLEQYDTLYYCSGSIIGQRWVLTAAHCVPKELNQHNLLGVNWNITHHSQVKEIATVNSSIVHPQFKYPKDKYFFPQYSQYDIALLKTKEPMQFNLYISSISLAARQPKLGQLAIVAGYGNSENDNLKKPREGDLIITPCPFRGGYFNTSIICSVGKVAVGGGDFGGPLVSQEGLIGVASGGDCDWSYYWGQYCESYFSNVYVLASWIRNTIR